MLVLHTSLAHASIDSRKLKSDLLVNMGCASSTNATTSIVASSNSDKSNGINSIVSGSVDFLPEVGYVIKARKEGNTKCFINVFHHSSVLYLLCDDAILAPDKSGEPCLTYQCCINTAVLTICLTNEDAKIYVSSIHTSYYFGTIQ